MKKRTLALLLALALLCLTGCSAHTQPLLQSSDAARLDFILMVPNYGGPPQDSYAAKRCTTDDMKVIVKALQTAQLGKETDTIYGGIATYFQLGFNDGTSTVIRIIGDEWVCIEDKYYACTNVPDLEELYAGLSAKEMQFVVHKSQPE